MCRAADVASFRRHGDRRRAVPIVDVREDLRWTRAEPEADDGVLEYHVERPRWSVAAAFVGQLVCDVATVYGERFAPTLGVSPASAFVAEGSEVALSRGVALAAGRGSK